MLLSSFLSLAVSQIYKAKMGVTDNNVKNDHAQNKPQEDPVINNKVQPLYNDNKAPEVKTVTLLKSNEDDEVKLDDIIENDAKEGNRNDYTANRKTT
ncbi:hypothetical protein B7463_g3429, partial [Scytalidium lignicola]